jgi:hypothetical protein
MSATRPNAEPRAQGGGVPAVAVLLGWFLPGAGHLYLGRVGLAAAGFAVVGGLYLLGLHLSGALTFEFLDPELRGRFAVLLTPEIGNLGGVLLQFQRNPLAGQPYQPAAYPPGIFLGSWLTALSGIANIGLLVHAHFEARKPNVQGFGASSPAVQVAAGWLVPGLGHVLQGRVKRGAVVALVLIGLFAAGCLLSEGTNLSRERHFYFWSGQFLMGLPAAVAEFASGRPVWDHEIPLLDYGLFYASLAGLLNLLVLIDVYGWQESKLLGLDPVEDRRAQKAGKSKDSSRTAKGSEPEAAATPAKHKHLVGGSTEANS